MGKTTFIVSDESVNSYGFIVMTDGIDTAKFERNPVMLYMHERKTVVGRWENIRKEGKRLLADAVFDESTDLGKTVKKQVEDGFLRSASMGFEIIEQKEINGVNTVTKCELMEISIVDIPANSNAMKLYKKGGRQFVKLAAPVRANDLKGALCELLNLPNDTADEVIISGVERLLNVPDQSANDIDEAIKAGYIDRAPRSDFITMARVTPGAFKGFIKGEREKRNKAVSVAVEEAVRLGRINFQAKPLFNEIGQIMGLEKLGAILHELPRRVKLSELINGGDKNGWTLEEYRRYAPDELKKDPKLYARLLHEEEERSPGTKTLDYYRRHDPEYLREHPEEYNRLLNNQ